MSAPGYATFIWSAYGFTALAVAALIVRAFLDHRAQSAALARLDAEAGAGGPGPSHE